jgi:hypothetical protein
MTATADSNSVAPAWTSADNRAAGEQPKGTARTAVWTVWPRLAVWSAADRTSSPEAKAPETTRHAASDRRVHPNGLIDLYRIC